MRTGWRDDGAGRAPRAGGAQLRQAPRPRCPPRSPARPWSSRAAREKVRANDTDYPFRPGSDFVYLTGDHDPDSVLVCGPNGAGHDAILYIRPRSPRDTDEFFRSRDGELWIGRRHTLAREVRPSWASRPRTSTDLADGAGRAARPGRTRVLRGLDPAVDARGAGRTTPDRRRHAATGSWPRRSPSCKLVKDEWEIAQLQDAIDATVRGFEDVARVLPADRAVTERLLEGVFGLRARHDGNDVGYSSIVGAGAHATILHWIRNDGAHHARASCC